MANNKEKAEQAANDLFTKLGGGASIQISGMKDGQGITDYQLSPLEFDWARQHAHDHPVSPERGGRPTDLFRPNDWSYHWQPMKGDSPQEIAIDNVIRQVRENEWQKDTQASVIQQAAAKNQQAEDRGFFNNLGRGALSGASSIITGAASAVTRPDRFFPLSRAGRDANRAKGDEIRASIAQLQQHAQSYLNPVGPGGTIGNVGAQLGATLGIAPLRLPLFASQVVGASMDEIDRQRQERKTIAQAAAQTKLPPAKPGTPSPITTATAAVPGSGVLGGDLALAGYPGHKNEVITPAPPKPNPIQTPGFGENLGKSFTDVPSNIQSGNYQGLVPAGLSALGGGMLLHSLTSRKKKTSPWTGLLGGAMLGTGLMAGGLGFGQNNSVLAKKAAMTLLTT